MDDMTNVLIFVPGIMGSCLHYTKAGVGEQQEVQIWSEDIYTSLRTLSDNPGLFKYNPHTRIDSGPIIKVLKLPLGIYSIDVYGSLTKTLAGLAKYRFHEFAYDWRRDIFHS